MNVHYAYWPIFSRGLRYLCAKNISTAREARKLSYRKDDRAMRPTYNALKNFDSP